MNSPIFRMFRMALIVICGLLLAGVFALACTYVYLAPSLPTAENMHKVELQVPLRVYTSSGGLISQIGEQRRIPVTYDEIPELVRHAVLAAEDDRFFEHHGVDWIGVARATIVNVATADLAGQGGSTITQQAARNMFLSLDKTLRRKLSEVFVTYRMEKDFTKEQILATYLNVIFFGQRSYGIAAAAETFYGKSLADLTVAQAATLAGIIQLPSRYNPVTNPKAAEVRRTYVLRRMTALGYIDEATRQKAAAEPIASRGFAPLFDVEAPYVAEMVRQDIVTRFGASAVNAGYKVFTTLDNRLQTAANRALRVGLIEYDRRHGYRGPIANVKLPSGASTADLDHALADRSAISMLQLAIVTKVADTSAEIYIRGIGPAQITWVGMSWARRLTKSGGLMANPRKAADVLALGDVVYVVTDRRGYAQLAQLPAAQGALVAMDPDDGAIVSLVGGFDYYTNKFNRVTQAKRQLGSGFKPFLYSAALEEGFTPASVILDMPIVLENTGEEEDWRPKNNSGEFGGPTRLRDALVYSKNLVSVRILQNIGLEAAISHATKFGFDRNSFPHDLTIALGSQSARPLDVATGFSVFANGGFKVTPYFISRIEDSSGKVVFENKPLLACLECETQAQVPLLSPVAPAPTDVTSGAVDTAAAAPVPVPRIHEVDAPAPLQQMARLQGGLGYLPADRLAPRVISIQNAWLMTDIMKGVITRGTARRASALGRSDLAGKTGTTNDWRDAWFSGFNRQLVASVWTGFDGQGTLGRHEEGSAVAVPVWMHFMREALRGVPLRSLDRPGGLIDLKIDPYSGTLADPLNPDAIYETFMLQHQPRMPVPGERSGAGAGGGAGGAADPLF
ncbi:MAG: PBP1A family penicillin-binding protein [Pseudomonadota bacterium]